MSVNGYAISRGTLYPQEAYEFLKFLVNHPNAVTANLSTAPAVIGLEPGGFGGPGGPGGGPGGGGFVPEAFAPLLDTAIERAISDTRFSSGITAALNLMESNGLDARAALDEIQNTFLTRLSIADTHAANVISVVAPTLPPVLAPGEVALNFALLGGGPGGGGFAQQQQWEAVGDQFVADDAEVGLIHFDNENPNDLATVAENYDCFYSGTNLVPDADLSLLLSFDPLVSVDPAFDPDDFIAGVFSQVKANNQMYAYPLQISPLVLRFNPDIFNQAGVPLPQSDWTVSDLQDALDQLKFVLTDDQFPLELNASGQTAMLMLIAAYGGIPFDTRTDPPTISFTDSATEGALQQVLDLLANGELTFSGGGFGPGGGQTDNTVPLYSNVINAFSFGFGGGPGGPGGGGPNAQNQNTDGIVPFPRGNQYNAVAFNLGTAYISASSENPEACYRFISYVAQSTELFDSMPARYSQLDNPNLAQAQGDETVAFYHDLANLIDQPTTLVFPNNINAGNFGMTNWLFQVFDRYVNGEVVDLNAELTDAEQSTRAYIDCVAALPPFNPGETNPQDFFAQIQACQSSATA